MYGEPDGDASVVLIAITANIGDGLCPCGAVSIGCQFILVAPELVSAIHLNSKM